ncbi:hypothetical protein B0J11DRAFT_446502 [Dendryphion nanum]|uniref:non-specific serine/threonine protein kinase n=1 Tax=Dendryphion nanum TaxID=256645 RepID=A0A9P9D5D2_9PLEO|nr:hypothetical protein B0J11DRAFT_446502 [Dendryphion nanum]
MIVSPDIYTTHVMPLLRLSDQCQIIPFESWTSDLDATVDISKIAEASFSEVYRLTVKSASEGCKGVSVLKLVALKTPPDAPLPSELTENERPRRAADLSFQLQKESTEREDHDSWKSNVQDVHSEVRLLQNLDTIPGFTIFRALTILKGRPSKSFGKAWKAWNKSRPRGSKSEFPDPTKKASYDDNQLWAVIEMEDAGTDCGKIMESGGISTIWEVWDIFWGVCSSVAKAEEACKFEHRDLHMDNICIRSSTSNPCLTQRTIANPLKRKLGFSGLETTVIDYTLSRADIIAESTSRRTSFFSTSGDDSFSASPKTDSSSSAEVAYLDLNKDPALFQGDAESEYQYEIYRYMRGVVLSQNPLAQTPSSSRPTTPDYTPETPRRSPRKHFDSSVPSTPQRSPRKSRPTESQSPPTDIWKRFHPKTNLIWAHFILHKLLENLAYAGNEPPHMSNAHITQNVEGIETEEQAGKVWKKAVKMYKILYRVSQKLEPTALAKEGSWGSMTEVIVNALEMRWLGLSDVNGGVWEEFGEGERERE